jgi:hypothetical protein
LLVGKCIAAGDYDERVLDLPADLGRRRSASVGAANERGFASLFDQSMACQSGVLFTRRGLLGGGVRLPAAAITFGRWSLIMPWWAPLGGLIGAFAVVAGLLFVDKIGAGAFAGLTITANILMSLAIDHFGWFNLPAHHMNVGRALGAALMIGGIALISRA